MLESLKRVAIAPLFTLGLFTASVTLVPLAGCNAVGQTSVPAGLQQAAQDVSLIASGLGSATLSLTGLVPPATLATIQKALTEINQVATLLGQAPTAAAGAPLVQQLEGSINAIVGATATLQLPGKWNAALAAVQVLLPVVEIAVGLVTPPRMARTAMTVEQARATLAAR